MNYVYMESPQGDDVRKVEATTKALTPLMAQGWHQVPAPVEPGTMAHAAPSQVDANLAAIHSEENK